MNMPFSRPILDENTQVDFYAGSKKAFDFLLPLWRIVPDERKGKFFTWDKTEEIQAETFHNYLPGSNPLVISDPADLTTVFYAGEERAFILIEFETHRQTRGLLATVSLFLSDNERDFKIRKLYSEKYQEVVQYSSLNDARNKIFKFIKGAAPVKFEQVNGKTVGLIYMAFGEKAGQAVKKSVSTLKRLGFSYPVCVVGDVPVPGFEFSKWEGESPFDPTQKKNFHFRAGRVKPFLYHHSPYDYTLYLDADTEFVKDIREGFDFLADHDVALTQEYLTVGELYNKFQAGWEINIEERDQSIKEGISPEEKFINSGVIFFRKSEANKSLFKQWAIQWKRFQQWDEQLSLMRALNKSKSSRKYLLPMWNDPHVHDNTIIFHNYGRGSVRTNV